MTLGQIIKDYRSENGMSMDSFSEKSGISKAYISLLEKNKHPKTGKPIIPSVTTIQQAAKGMGVDFNVLIQQVDGYVRLSQQTPRYSNISPITTKSFPLFDGIAAGEPRLMPDGITLYVEASTDIKADFVIRVHGDSMTGARINDGDYVFIRQQPEVENGEIAAVAIGEDATLKRFYKHGDMVILHSENPNYKDMVFTGDDAQDIHVMGKAVAFQSDVM